jgi:hypothetical protein
MKISDVQKKQIVYIGGGTTGLILLCFAAYWLVQVFRNNHSRPFTNHKFDFSPSRYISDLTHAVENIQAKVTRIRNSAEENEKLRLENMNLKVNIETIKYSSSTKAAQLNTEDFELRLSKETGAKVGRSLSGINYQAPQMFPSQLYTLALAYVVARDDEKAAVLLTLLTGQEGKATYKTAKDYLMTGVVWYRIENLLLADYYFDQVLKLPETELSIQSQAQARLWKAIVAEKLQKNIKAQFWLKELVDHHPNSVEANWVNSAEGKHETAKE